MTLSIYDAAEQAPEHPFLIQGPARVTFSRAKTLAEQAVSLLQEQGLDLAQSGAAWDRPLPALEGRNDLSTTVALCAFFTWGRPVLLLPPRFTEPEKRALLDRVAPTLVVDPSGAPLGTSAKVSAPPTHAEESPAALVPTSGSTGTPKLVVLSRRAFLASAKASAKNLGFLPDDRWLLSLSLAHIGGLSILTRCLLARRTVVLLEDTSLSRPGAQELARTIDAQRVTLLSLVPAQLSQLLDLEPVWNPPDFLRAALVGGAPAPPALLERAAERGWPVLTTYGLTEACSQVATQGYGTVNRGDQGCGYPLPGVEVRVLNGSIQVRGPTLFSGYYVGQNQADTSIQAVDPGELTEGQWFETSDLGELDSLGRLWVHGRSDDVIVTGGEKFHPAEVERFLEQHPAVRRACVFGIPDPTWGQVVAAALECHPDRPALDMQDLLEHCSRDLASFKRPRRVALVDVALVPGSDQVDRKRTAERASARLKLQSE
jgi:O-succinylbenzoic acid--CoA ligase